MIEKLTVELTVDLNTEKIGLIVWLDKDKKKAKEMEKEIIKHLEKMEVTSE